MSERLVLAVLRRLWHAGPAGVVPMQQLLRETLAPLPDLQHALELIAARHCTLDRSPAGIRLVSAGLPCWQDLLEEFARTRDLALARRVLVFATTTSTNDIAWQCATSPDSHGMLVLADHQSAGRGRLGHHWESPPGTSILMSLVLHLPRLNPHNDARSAGLAGGVDALTLVAGLAAAEGLEQGVQRCAPAHPGVRVEIKWPNDLLLPRASDSDPSGASTDRKVAGILVERRGDYVVIGIGINATQSADDFPAQIINRAISLQSATGVTIDRSHVVAAVVERLDTHLRCLSDENWIQAWKSRCTLFGKRITARVGDGQGAMERTGDVLDVAPLQGLVVRDQAGATHFLSAQTTHVISTH